MELKQALDDKQMDYRLRDRLISEGKISKDAVQEYLTQLPDETPNIKPTKQSSAGLNSDTSLS